mmetsp:Transcript_13804/g.24968  ORF Transcript_13804/g.24968 Transcript_13804/m.24968 type:complete len:293 (+) Transcript_13804:206-1084(+)
MIHNYVILAAAIDWLARPSHATRVTVNWHKRDDGHEIRNQSIEKSLHVALKGRRNGHDRNLAEEDPFVGPGVLECNNAVCTFEVDEELGCADPCHTLSGRHMYDYPFSSISNLSSPNYSGASDAISNDGLVRSLSEPCSYRKAKNINTWEPELISIEEGCTARCTGCTFAGPTISVQGAATLECIDGRCVKYVHGNTFQCGNAIEAASEASGSISILSDGEDISDNFYGFEGINGSINLPATCSLECTGCKSYPIVRLPKVQTAEAVISNDNFEDEVVPEATNRLGGKARSV